MNTTPVAIQTAADRIATARRGWLAGHKVLIADVADALGTTVGAFAPMLQAARQRGELRRSRCDMPSAGDVGRVRASEVSDGYSVVHLVETRCYAY